MSSVSDVTDAVAAASLADASGSGASPPPSSAIADGGEQVVTPWDVAGGADGKIDYAKLVTDFGCSTITPELIARVERVTGVRAHPFLRRGMFFAHRGSIRSSTRTSAARSFTSTPAEARARKRCTSAT